MILRLTLVLAALVGSLSGFGGGGNGPLSVPFLQRCVAVPAGDHVVLHAFDGRVTKVPLSGGGTTCEDCTGFGMMFLNPPPTKFSYVTVPMPGAKGKCQYFQEILPTAVYLVVCS